MLNCPKVAKTVKTEKSKLKNVFIDSNDKDINA